MKILAVLAAVVAVYIVSKPLVADELPYCEEGQTENCILLE